MKDMIECYDEDAVLADEIPNLTNFYLDYSKATLKILGVQANKMIGGMPKLVMLLRQQSAKGKLVARELLEDMEDAGIIYHGKVQVF